MSLAVWYSGSDEVNLHWSAPKTLTLSHSREDAIAALLWLIIRLVLLGVGVFFFVTLFPDTFNFYFNPFHRSSVSIDWTYFAVETFFGAALFLALVVRVTGLIRVLRGVNFSFDQTTRTIQQNGADIGKFDDVEHVQIHTIADGDTSAKDDYLVLLYLKQQQPLHLALLDSQVEALRISQEISAVLGIAIKQTGRTTHST